MRLQMKMILAASALVAAGMAFADGATPTTYAVEGAWNAVSTAGYTSTNDLTTARGWTSCPTSGVSVASGVVVLDDALNPLVYTPTDPTVTNAYETAYVALTDFESGDMMEVDLGDEVQAAICAAWTDSDDTDKWYGWCCTNANQAGWFQFDNVPTNGTCMIRVEFNNTNNTKLVRYAVKYEDETSYTILTAGDVQWVTNAVSSVERVNDVEFAGSSAFNKIEFTQSGLLTASKTFEERRTAKGIEPGELNAVTNNHNRNWENIVLNLNGAEETSQPVVQPVQTTSTGKIALKLGGVNVDTTTCNDVKYTVITSDTPDGEGTESVAKTYDTVSEMDLPSSGVRYYRMKVVLTPKGS